METEKMHSKVNNFNFKDKNRFTEILSAMNEQRQQRQLCDVILKVADKAFYAHRNVLAATSLYFRAMFINDMAESQMKEITMKEIEPSVLDSLINFAYSAEVRIDNENVRRLMIGASHLQLSRVQDSCAEFLVSQLNPADVLGTRNFARSIKCFHLVARADEHIRQNFSEISLSTEFLNLNIEDLLEIIESDNLEVDSEETTYEASMRWIKANQEERVPLLPRVLAKIRLHLLSPQFLVERVSKEDLIRLSLTCRDLVDEAIHFHSFQGQRERLKNSRARHRRYGNNVETLYVVGGEESDGNWVGSVEIYDPVANKWELGEGMLTERCEHGVAVALGKLFVVGGYNVWETLSIVEVFDPKIRKWSQVPKMISGRSSAGVAVLNNLIYVCGGFGWDLFRLNAVASRTVECFCPASGTWKMVALMMERRWGGAAASLDGYVYVAGGRSYGPGLDSVEKYDPEENFWVQVQPMIQKRVWFGLTSLNGKLYACGGRNSNGVLHSAEIYNPAEDAWTIISPMNCKRSGLALVGNLGKLWAIGGWDGESNLSSVEVYDPALDKWSFVAPMCVPRYGAAAAVVIGN